MRRIQNSQVEFNPRWFKVWVLSRRVVDEQTREILYTSASCPVVAAKQLRDGLGIGYIIRMKEISYDQVVKEVSRES